MSAARLHHPQCGVHFGGTCSGCVATRAPKAHEPDITCSACGETYLIAAENPIAHERALRDWVGCCTPTDTPAATGGEAPAAGATNQARAADGPAARVMARWVSGRPGWVVRRQAVAW